MEDVLDKLKLNASTKMETENSKGGIIISRGSLLAHPLLGGGSGPFGGWSSWFKCGSKKIGEHFK